MTITFSEDLAFTRRQLISDVKVQTLILSDHFDFLQLIKVEIFSNILHIIYDFFKARSTHLVILLLGKCFLKRAGYITEWQYFVKQFLFKVDPFSNINSRQICILLNGTTLLQYLLKLLNIVLRELFPFSNIISAKF